jgi:hypothetical protein
MPPTAFFRSPTVPPVHRQVCIATVVGRPHSAPVEVAIKAARTMNRDV